MKKLLLFVALLVLVSTSTMFAQTLMDYVLQVRGDTLVIKDYNDMGSVSSSLTNALNLDTLAVSSRARVYVKEERVLPSCRQPDHKFTKTCNHHG